MRTPRVLWPLVWAVLQLGWRPGWPLGSPDRPRPWGPLALSPARLTVPEGANATFTCSLSRAPTSLWLNWYRVSPSNQMDKLAAFPQDSSQPTRDPRFRITKLPGGSDFLMSVLAARLNDSGTYLCGAIHLPPEAQITESPRAELTVTERAMEPPTAQPSPAPGPAGQLQVLVVGVSSAVVGVLLLLLAWVLATTCPRRSPGASRAQHKDVPPKARPFSVSVLSVDYGELDFELREKTPEPSAPCAPEQTEYATIVFPPGPAGGPGAPPVSRRGSADGLRAPRPPRPEDGHCSWPL